MIFAEAASSLESIQRFLIESDKDDEERSNADKDLHGNAKAGIHLQHAAFRYDGHDGHGFKLTVPKFSVEPGEVVAIVGRVGAGKSAMLDALLGNMPNECGEVKVGGRIAYVPQVSTCDPCQEL